VPVTLTPRELQVLELYRPGNRSSKQIGDLLGVSRQRTDEIIDALRRKVLTTEPSQLATTRQTHLPDSKANPWPPAARRARQGEFVMRSGILAREDGLELPDGAIPDECSITWTCYGAPRRLGWSWAVSRLQPWTVEDTSNTYADWCMWLNLAQANLPTRQMLPPINSEPAYDLIELTRTLAWVIGVEGLIYPQQSGVQ
jgi:sigma-70-like protein